MAEIKQCPFCGGKARIEEKISGEWVGVESVPVDQRGLFRVACCNCDAARIAQTSNGAVGKWNTRAGVCNG